jgi:hypothetical protein
LNTVSFFPALSVTSNVFGGAASEPSRRPKARAHRKGGNTRAFQNNMLSRVSLSDGGEPRFVEIVAMDEEDEDAMRSLGF